MREWFQDGAAPVVADFLSVGNLGRLEPTPIPLRCFTLRATQAANWLIRVHDMIELAVVRDIRDFDIVRRLPVKHALQKLFAPEYLSVVGSESLAFFQVCPQGCNQCRIMDPEANTLRLIETVSGAFVHSQKRVLSIYCAHTSLPRSRAVNGG